MAQVASVNNIDRNVRTLEQVAGTEEKPKEQPPRPVGLLQVFGCVDVESAEFEYMIDDVFNHMTYMVFLETTLSKFFENTRRIHYFQDGACACSAVRLRMAVLVCIPRTSRFLTAWCARTATGTFGSWFIKGASSRDGSRPWFYSTCIS